MGFPGGSVVKNSQETQETSVQFLGQEDPLEKEKATHSSILPREFHGLYSPWGCKESDMTGIFTLLPPVAQLVKNLPANTVNKRHEFNPWVRKIPWRRKRQHNPVFLPGKSHR